MIENDEVKVFSDDDVIDIEEQQDKNVFDNIKDQLEENYLELENMI